MASNDIGVNPKGDFQPLIYIAETRKVCKIEPKLPLVTKSKSCMPIQLVPNSMTLHDLEAT